MEKAKGKGAWNDYSKYNYGFITLTFIFIIL